MEWLTCEMVQLTISASPEHAEDYVLESERLSDPAGLGGN